MPFEPRAPDERLFKSSRLYAYLEDVQPEDSSPDDWRKAVFDAVDADWVDSREGLVRFDEDAPTSILAVEVPPRFPLDRVRNPGWWEIDLRRSAFKAEHYASLFHLPIERGAGPPEPLGPTKSAQLDESAGLDRYPDATEERIRYALRNVGRVDDVAVCDVGHGNCNAVCKDGRVAAYYDFGGGVLWNVGTYPRHIAFCYGDSPPVVLSHWDWDHWASVMRHPAALTLDWIVPRQAFKGPNHSAFAAALDLGGHLLIWPPGLESVQQGSMEIVKCDGTSRNDSGLAVYVDDPRDENQRILLAGDAAYPYIPAGKPLSSLVVSHHGGKRSIPGVPAPHSVAHKLAYSYGDDNRYSHPTDASKQEHQDAGWRREFHTASTGGRRGHVRLPSAPPRRRACDAKDCCGGTCTLDLTK